MKKIDKREYNKSLYKMVVIKNLITLIVFAVLSIFFNKWGLMFLSILFWTYGVNDEEE